MATSGIPSYDLSDLRILVIDDSKNMRAIILEALRALGIRETKEADDGAEGLKMLHQFTFDLVLCDWNMQPIDGIEFTRMVRKASDLSNPFLPIIMLTGHTEYSRVIEARDAGIHEFMAKPISPKSMYRRIVSVIRNNRDFVKTSQFFGPDRRRQDVDLHGGSDRRSETAVDPEESGET